MYISIFVFIIQILNFAQASLDCSTIKGTALNSYAYKIDGSVQFEFVILTSGNVDLTFPIFWNDSPSISPLIIGTTTCRETVQSITCTQDNHKFTCGTLRAGNQIIRCNNVKGPHTNKQIGNFTIQFAQQSCNNIMINNFQPYGGSVVFSSNSTNLYPNTDKLQMIWENIVLPISFTSNPLIEVQILSNGEFITTSTVKGYVSARSIGQLESLTIITPNLIKAQMPQSIAVKDVSIKLYMETLKVMGNTQPIQSQIDFKDSNDVLQYQIIFPTILVQNDQLIANLNIDQTEINIYAKYTFSITIKNVLNSLGFVRIALAQTLLSSNLICYCDNIVSIPIINTDYIDIGGCLTTIGIHNIEIQNVLNPKSTISTISISYIETMQNGFSVDRITNFQYKSPSFTPGTLNVQYERQGNDQDIVGGHSYFILKIIPKNSIPSQGFLMMEIPQEIKFINQNAQICNVDIYGCQIQLIQDQILIFKFSSQIESQQLFIINQISIPIRNPYDTSQTNYFKFTTYDQFNNIIDTISNVQGYSVNTRSSFDGLIIIESDQPFKNGQSNTFYFTIKTKTPQFYPIQMIIKVGDLTINNNPLCKLEGALIKTCTKISSNQLDIQIQSTDSFLLPTILKLSVSTIKCKDTMTKSQDFEFSTQSTNGLMSYQLGPYINNIQFGDITQTELKVDKQYYGASNALYQFNFIIQNGLIQDNHQIHILFPFNLPSLDYQCKDTINNKLICNIQSNNILVFTGPFDSTQLQYKLIINGLPTPLNEQQPRTFTIKTYRRINNNNYLVDSSVNGAFQFNIYCPQLNNCRTCKIIDSYNIQCDTCYTSMQSKYIYMKSNICVDQCGDGYYQNNQEFICQQCPNNCQVCQLINNILICDKCFDNYKYQDSICVDNCEDTYYLPFISNNNKCEKCDSECILCSMNSSYCSKCQQNIPIKDNKCYKNGCLQGYYQTYNTNQILICELCPDTCISCNSYNQCIECQPGQYYLSGTCRGDCPLGYFINEQQMQCKQCVSECSQCQNDTTCVKCLDGFLLKQQQCVLTCGEQYYIDITQTSCLKCNQYCQTCELKDEIQICTSCINQYFFSNFNCVQQCEQNYYDLNNECYQCSSNCLTCAGSPDMCTSCLIQGDIPQFLNGTICVSQCSDNQFADITSGKCIECPSNCIKCTSLTNCTQCNQSLIPHYLIQGVCKQECPYNYQPIGLFCELVQDKIITNNESNRYVPFPHVILYSFFTISVLLSKQFKSETYMPGSIIGLSTPLIWSSWFTVLFLLFKYDDEFKDLFYFWILIGSMGLNYLFNIFHLLLLYQKIWNDQEFIRWQAQSLKNKVTNFILLSLSILIAYPLYKLIMSRYFGFSFFKAKIVDIKPFFYFNFLNVLYIIFVNVPIIISCIFIIYYEQNNTQTFISAIDSIVVTFSNILLLIWETQKNKEFFDEFNQNYYLNESKQQLEKHEISGYFQHPLEQKSQAEQKIDMDVQEINQENDIIKQKSQEQSCNLNEISIILSDNNQIFQQESNRSNQFHQKQIIPFNLKHTIYYKNIQNNQLQNPDDEPPYVSSGSENLSSIKSQQHYQQSFNDQSQCSLKDISLIQDSNENSQLSIFDEDKNISPQNKKQNTQYMQDYDNDENNPQQINQQIDKSKSSCKKTKSQLTNNQGENNILSNNISSQSSREIIQPLSQLQVQYYYEQNKVLSSNNNTRSVKSLSINKVQQEQLQYNQIHQQNIDNYNSINSNQFKSNNNLEEDQQQQIEVSDQQPQFNTQESMDQCRILMDSRTIEENQNIFQDQIQQIKSKPLQQKIKQKEEQIKNESEIKNIFDTNDQSDQEWEENQISPSEFNSLNQRFENEQELDLYINIPNYSKTQQNYRQNQLNSIGDNNEQQSQQIQVDVIKKKETQKQQLEKVYLQKLDQKIINRSNKLEFRKKHTIKNHPKDISDAYIDDQIDVEDINF